MCLKLTVHFLTFVLVLTSQLFIVQSKAAPQTDLPPRGLVLNDEEEYFYPQTTVRSTWDFGVGAGEGVFDTSKIRKNLTLFSVGKTHYQENKTAYGYSIELSSEEVIGLESNYRWIFSDFIGGEPYLGTGLVLMLEPEDQLGNFIDYKRYYVQGTLGLDNLFQMRRMFKVELGARVGASGTHILSQFIFGLNF